MDVSARRLQALSNAAQAQGLAAIVTTRPDDLRRAAEEAREGREGALPLGGFDKVLLDAPCSGGVGGVWFWLVLVGPGLGWVGLGFCFVTQGWHWVG